MVTVSELQSRVASDFARLDLPAWPNPRPGMASPREEEYSRVTDPQRYRVVHARARVWAAVLQDALGVDVETLAPAAAGGGLPAGFDRGVRIVPRRPDALPLLLLERDAPSGEATLAVLEIAVVRPDITVETLPDCGCDACDTGSDNLLDAIDAAIGHVVEGPFVVLRAKKWRAQWHPEGGGSSSDGRGPDFATVMGLCRRLAEGEPVRLPRSTEALVGHSWLG